MNKGTVVEKKYNVKGDLIIKGPINGDLTVYVGSCKNIHVEGNVSGNTNLNVDGIVGDTKIDQSTVTKKYYTLGFFKWIKGLLKM